MVREVDALERLARFAKRQVEHEARHAGMILEFNMHDAGHFLRIDFFLERRGCHGSNGGRQFFQIPRPGILLQRGQRVRPEPTRWADSAFDQLFQHHLCNFGNVLGVLPQRRDGQRQFTEHREQA